MEELEYGQEPALPHELLPGLRAAEELPERSGCEELFTGVTVRRAATRLRDCLDSAIEVTERYTEGV